MFKDRYDAAEQLAEELKKYKDSKNAIIVAIPRGALEIGNPLAKKLNLPLDIVLTKKIGAPGNPEYAIGAASLDSYFVNPNYESEEYEDYIKDELKKIRETIKERSQKYRKDMPPLNIENKIVIIVDDGVATGNTILAAIELIKKQNPKKIVVAIPVGPKDTINKIKEKVDDVVCPLTPEHFYAIGAFYQMFPQVEDEEAIRLLQEVQK